MSTHVPGKLKFKGSSTGAGKKKSKKKRQLDEISDADGTAVDKKVTDPVEGEETVFLTESQRKHEAKKKKLEAKLAKEAISTTYRDRVEAFNYKLSTMTEHNDIPRISAAGNG